MRRHRRGGAGADSACSPRPSGWLAELVVGLVQGSSSPVVPVGQEFIDWTPTWLKDWAIEQFGTSDKAVLVAGALIVVLGLGAIVGVLDDARGEREAYALTGVVGVVGAWAVLIRPDPTFAKLLPTLVGTRRLARRALVVGPETGLSDEEGRQTMIGLDRRQFSPGCRRLGLRR